MSEVKVNKLSPRSGTTVTLGDSGDTISVPSGVTLSGAGTITPSDSTVTSAKLSGALVTPSTLDVNGNELILDADADTSITADTDDQIDFKTAGSDRMSIISDGKVGIGTTSPTRELTVGNVANARIEILSNDNSSGASQLQFGDPDNSQIGRIYYEHSDNSMRFHVNNTEELRILDGGGITFNGDTAAANALNDYEEGTWTPSYAGSTSGSISYGSRGGTYTKVGNLVVAWFSLVNFTTTGSWAGDLKVTGLPFTCNQTNNVRVCNGICRFYNINTNTNTRFNVTMDVDINNTHLVFLQSGDDTNWESIQVETTSTSYLEGTISYRTDS